MGQDQGQRSPLKRSPLRQAGQSLREAEAEKLDKVGELALAPCLMLMMACYEWWGWWNNLPRRPFLLFAAAAVVLAYSVWRLIPLRRDIRNLRKGQEAERVVGEQLEQIARKLQMQVYHDLQGEGFNVDHVLIGAQGIFCVESKYRSKPLRGQTVIEYDGTALQVNGGPPDTSAVIQAKAQAHYLREILPDVAGGKPRIQAIVVYPGWYVKQTNKLPTGSVWVLNPDMIEGHLAKLPVILIGSQQDVIKWALESRLRASKGSA